MKKFYRDPETKKIAGVSGGIAAYLGLDITLVRIILLVLLIMGSLGFWLYIICWIVAPLAETPEQKREMRGLNQ